MWRGGWRLYPTPILDEAFDRDERGELRETLWRRGEAWPKWTPLACSRILAEERAASHATACHLTATGLLCVARVWRVRRLRRNDAAGAADERVRMRRGSRALAMVWHRTAFLRHTLLLLDGSRSSDGEKLVGVGRSRHTR